MTIHQEPESLTEPLLDPSEALIEEARQRHRRRLIWTALALAILAASGAIAFAVVASGGSGSTSNPVALASPGGNARLSISAGRDAGSLGLTPAFLASCSTNNWTNNLEPAGTKFSLVRSGTVGTTPWSLWFAVSYNYFVAYSAVVGSSSSATCMAPGSGGGGIADQTSTAQFPGKQIAFVLGYVPLSVTKVETAVNGINVSITPKRFGSSPYKYVFGAVTGLRCASANAIQGVGMFSTTTEYIGTKSDGTNGGVDVGNVRYGDPNGAVPCGTFIQPLAMSVASDVAAAPAALREAILRTIQAKSLKLVTTNSATLAPDQGPNVSFYNSPDRWSGPFMPMDCARDSSASTSSGGTVQSVIGGSTYYDVQEHCLGGRLAQQGANAPGVGTSPAPGFDGLTAAQLAAFQNLLTDVHIGSHFTTSGNAYDFTSELQQDGRLYLRTPGRDVVSLSGSITVENGYVSSFTATTPACQLQARACSSRSTTQFLDVNTAPSIQIPKASSY